MPDRTALHVTRWGVGPALRCAPRDALLEVRSIARSGVETFVVVDGWRVRPSDAAERAVPHVPHRTAPYPPAPEMTVLSTVLYVLCVLYIQ